MGKSAEKGCWWWLRRVKVSIRHLWQSKTANFLWEKWTLQYCCRCPIAEKYSTIQLLQSWFIRQPALYHCHLQPPSVLSHLTSSACVSYHHGNRHTRETWRRKKEREGERWRGLTHLLILPCTWKWAPQLGILEKACILVYLECV